MKDNKETTMKNFKYCKVVCGPHVVLFEVKTEKTICVWTQIPSQSQASPFDFHPKTAIYNIRMQFMIYTYGVDFGWSHMSEQAMKDKKNWIKV